MQHTWLITGCSSGLGRSIAKAALQRGDKVAVTARQLESLQDFIEHYPEQALALHLDLNDRFSMEQAVQTVCSQFGNLDILINNAGHGYRATVEESEAEQVAELFETNFFAPMSLIQMILPYMRKNHKGTIVNITSIGAVRGALGNGYYSAAKGALERASEALAKEVRHMGIRIMLVEPGAMRTGFYGERLKASKCQIEDYDILSEKYRKSESTNHHRQPDDPEKCGSLIVKTVLQDNAPFRLILGTDALEAAKTALTNRINELNAWAAVSTQAEFIK